VSETEIHSTIDADMIALELEHGEYEHLLAHLLINEVAFLNTHNAAFFKGGRDEGISVNVLCSDTFSYACADCERLDYDQIPVLYRLWQKDPTWAGTVWSVARRKERPIAPVAKRMAERGYDVDALVRGELP
jgi:hypothetical protein